MATARSSVGSNVVFMASGFTAQITSWRLGPIARRALETSHMGTAQPTLMQIANATYLPGKLSGGTDIILVIHFDPDELPPITALPEPVHITFPRLDTEPFAVRWVCTGFVRRVTILGALNTGVAAECMTQLTGAVVRGTDATTYYTEEFEWGGLENVTIYYTEEFEWGGLENVTIYYTEEYES